MSEKFPPGDGICVRLCGPPGTEPVLTRLPAVPREGDLLRTPWRAAVRASYIAWDIDPGRDPVLIVTIRAA